MVVARTWAAPYFLSMILVMVCLLFPASASAQLAQTGSRGGVLVKTRVQAIPSEVMMISPRARIGARLVRKYNHLGMEYWQLPVGMRMADALSALRHDSNIIFAEPNYERVPSVLPNDTLFAQQWSFLNSGKLVVGGVGATPYADMSLPSAWDTTAGSRAVVVAVVDSGVDIRHEDLAANIWTNAGEIPGNGVDDDGNGYIDDVHGWDFINNDNDPSPDAGKLEGHGTAVAGCIGAVGNNGIGITGSAQKVSIMPLKFAYDVASEIAALDYALANGADIVNISFGGPQKSRAETDAIISLQRAGILVVAAAGNHEVNNDVVPDYPSGLPNPNILSVAASDANDRITAWTQYGASSVDVLAPGEAILTTMASNHSIGNSALVPYDYTQGSSFSAPLVAGVAALVKAKYPLASYAELRGRIMAGVDHVPTASGRVASEGRVNASKALSLVPAPLLVVKDKKLVEVVGNGDGVMDPGETMDLSVELENLWSSASTITATLVSHDPYVTIINGQTSFPVLVTDSYGYSISPFRFQLGNIRGHAMLSMELRIAVNGIFTVSRYLYVEAGTLGKGVVYQQTIQQNDQDDYQVFHINVPSGASTLSVSTMSSVDVDLIVCPDHIPSFGFSPPNGGTWVDTADPYVIIDGNATGNESITVPKPRAGTYYAIIVNFSQKKGAQYSISADFILSDKDGDGVSDAQDAFPMDPAVSSDTDGDGHADAWNDNATAEMITASLLSGVTLDADINNASVWRGKSYVMSNLKPVLKGSDLTVYWGQDTSDPLSPLGEWFRVRGTGTQLIPGLGGAIADVVESSDGITTRRSNGVDGVIWYGTETTNPSWGVMGQVTSFYSFSTPASVPPLHADFTRLMAPSPVLPAVVYAGDTFQTLLAIKMDGGGVGQKAWLGSMLEVISVDDAGGKGYDLTSVSQQDYQRDWDINWKNGNGDPRSGLVRVSARETLFDLYGRVVSRGTWREYLKPGIGNVLRVEETHLDLGASLYNYRERLEEYHVGGLVGVAANHVEVQLQLQDVYGYASGQGWVYGGAPNYRSFALYEDSYASGLFTLNYWYGDLLDVYAGASTRSDPHVWPNQDLYALSNQSSFVVPYPIFSPYASPLRISRNYRLIDGWNLISFPMSFSGDSLQIFRDAITKTGATLHSIWSYDHGVWLKYLPSIPSMSDLKLLDGGKGYWVNISAPHDVIFPLEGFQYFSESYALHAGWNLIGFNTISPDMHRWLVLNGSSSIWGFVGGGWESYLNAVPGYLNALQSISLDQGYYVWQP